MIETMPRYPKAVIFDLWETLITEFDPDWTPGNSVAEHLGVSEEMFREGWRGIHNRRMMGGFPDYPSALRYLLRSWGQTPDGLVLDQLHRKHLQQKSKHFTDLDVDVLSMLAGLRARSIKTRLLSNAAQEEVVGWTESRLSTYFDDAVFSCDVGLMKPDVAIYELTCSRLRVQPCETVFVGDGGSDELAGAIAAGLSPLWATWFLDRWPDRISHIQPIPSSVRRAEHPSEVIQIIKR